MDANANAADRVAAGLTALVGWSTALDWDALPEAVKRRAALVLADDLAAMVAARDEPELAALQAGLATTAGVPEATVFNGRAQRLDRYSAAMANGAASDGINIAVLPIAIVGASNETAPRSGASFGAVIPMTPMGSIMATAMLRTGGLCTAPSYLSAHAA